MALQDNMANKELEMNINDLDKMSLRDFAAEMVILGMLSGLGGEVIKNEIMEAMIVKAYEIADSMALKRMESHREPMMTMPVKL